MHTARTDLEHDYTVKAVNKAIELLEVLVEFETGATLPQLSSRVKLTRNSTFRVMKTLAGKGLVEQDPVSGTYRLGINSVTLAQKMLQSMSVINYAHPVLEDLVRRHDEAAYLTVIRDGEVLFLDMVDCDRQIKAASLVGRRFPFFSNAAGKVMKSLESYDIIEKLLKKRGRKGAGAPDLQKLQVELSNIRDTGVAVDRGGLGEGIISVAVAVKDYTGKVVGAITLIGPSFRMLTDRLEKEIIPSLKDEAQILSGKFGYAPA